MKKDEIIAIGSCVLASFMCGFIFAYALIAKGLIAIPGGQP